MKKITFLVAILLLMGACAPAPTTDTLTVYFLDETKFATGTEPYEKAVSRTIPIELDRWNETLNQIYLGPTEEEQEQGLRVVLSGTTGFTNLEVTAGVARITLVGECNSGGSTYTIANLIFANLKQFPAIHYVKIYDQEGETEDPYGKTDSIPTCLEP